MKRDALDAIFSDLVRERADWTCERCRLYLPERKGRGMHCSHHYGRRNRSVRWYPLNAACLCHNCHQWYTDYPFEGAQWLARTLGPLLDILRERAHTPRKYTAAERREMLAHYREQHARLMQRRHEGCQGRLEFEGYD